MPELSLETQQHITTLSERGNALADAGRYEDAHELFAEAWGLLPPPQSQWEAATWLLAAIGDVCLLKGELDEAREALQLAMHCPDGLGNPFLHLRLGQVQFDLGEEDRAADELMRAFMGAGEDIFADENPKYLAFLRTRADIA